MFWFSIPGSVQLETNGTPLGLDGNKVGNFRSNFAAFRFNLARHTCGVSPAKRIPNLLQYAIAVNKVSVRPESTKSTSGLTENLLSLKANYFELAS